MIAGAGLLSLPDLFEDGSIAFAGSPDRVTVGAQIDRGQHGAIVSAHQNGLGGGGAHIQAQDAVVPGINPSPGQGFKFHLIAVILQGGQIVEGSDLCRQ